MDDMMMKYAETIQVRRNEALEKAICVEIIEIIGESGMNTIVELNPKAIVRAIEKQMSRKPLYLGGDCEFLLCPSCKQSLDKNMEDNFCSVCGQALKWGE